MNISTEDKGVFTLDLTVEQCREVDEEVQQLLEEALDEAQGFVFSDEGEVAYLLIEVRR